MYRTVLVSNVPVMGDSDDRARRFINLVDEFYDRNVKLILSRSYGDRQTLFWWTA